MKTIMQMKCRLTLLDWMRPSVTLLHHLPSLSQTLWMATISPSWFLLLQVKRVLMPRQLEGSSSSTKIQRQLNHRLGPTCPKLCYNTYLRSILREERALWTSRSSIFGNLLIAMRLESTFSISRMPLVDSLKLIQNSKVYSRPRNSNGRLSRTIWILEQDQKY